MSYELIAQGYSGNMVANSEITSVPNGTRIRLYTRDKLSWDQRALWDSWLGETIVGDPTSGYLKDIEVQCNPDGYGQLDGYVIAPISSGDVSGWLLPLVVASLCIVALGTVVASLYLIITGDFGGVVESFKWVAIAGAITVVAVVASKVIIAIKNK